MTAEIDGESSETDTRVASAQGSESETETINSRDIPNEILDIIEFLSYNMNIVFKSQQIDDPELLRSEKVQIAREIYGRSRQTFLMRFGSYLEDQHLTTYSLHILDDEHCEEMQMLLQDYRNKLHSRRKDIKNRRYAAMRQLISDGEYFSEQEMMKRAPELYQDLIGQYLSDAEKKQRDTYDVKNTTFSGILMHTMEQREIQDVLQQADKTNIKIREIGSDDSIEDPASENSSKNSDRQARTETFDGNDVEVPVSFRQQWGNFDNETVACSTSRQIDTKSQEKMLVKRRIKSNPSPETFITAGERDLLRQEFIGIMHEQFLNGEDTEFDYTQVDDNSQLDDLSQLNQDKEDAYFEESDCSESKSNDSPMIHNYSEDNEQSEDELDVFMSHLNKHHSLQK